MSVLAPIALEDSHDAEQTLRRVFGHDAFRAGQREVIEAVLEGLTPVAEQASHITKVRRYFW